MPNNKKLFVYRQTDMQMVMDYMNGLLFKGIDEARKLSTVATILESGQPLEDYLKERSDKDGTTEQDGQGGDGTV